MPFERLEAGRPLPAHLRGAVIALGNFDGLHAGHQAVVARAVGLARERGVGAIVATFDPHPVRHFRPGTAPFLLTDLDQRHRLFAATGADAMMVLRFDDELARVTPEDFVGRWLAGIGGVVTGENFRFGQGREGDVALLAELGARHGIHGVHVAPIASKGLRISSSRIREALKAGDCGTARRLLTRPFAVQGVVREVRAVPGRSDAAMAAVGLGDYVAPRDGAYAVRVRTRARRDVEALARCSCGNEEGVRRGVVDLLVLAEKHLAVGERVEIAFDERVVPRAGPGIRDSISNVSAGSS